MHLVRPHLMGFSSTFIFEKCSSYAESNFALDRSGFGRMLHVIDRLLCANFGALGR